MALSSITMISERVCPEQHEPVSFILILSPPMIYTSDLVYLSLIQVCGQNKQGVKRLVRYQSKSTVLCLRPYIWNCGAGVCPKLLHLLFFFTSITATMKHIYTWWILRAQYVVNIKFNFLSSEQAEPEFHFQSRVFTVSSTACHVAPKKNQLNSTSSPPV